LYSYRVLRDVVSAFTKQKML